MWDQIGNLGITVLGVVGTGLSIYFANTKIGHHIDVHYSINSSRSFDTRISDIILKNNKDKPESIHKIFAVIDKEFYLELKKFDDPLILEGYGSCKVDTPPYSYLMINNDIYVQNYIFSKVEIYIKLFDKIIKCNEHTYSKSNFNFKQISKITKTYNNIVYNNRVSYILDYVLDGKLNTAFIYDSGAITEEWKLHYNFIKPHNEKITPNEIIGFLRLHCPEIPAYELFKVNDQTLKFESIKKFNFNNI